MPKIGKLVRQDQPDVVLLTRVKWCSSYWCKLKGLMFRTRLTDGEGLLLVETVSSKVATAITMVFMFMPIAVIWFDEEFVVVDKVHAKPWIPGYVPSASARYVLEANVALLEKLDRGDRVIFESQS